MTNQNINSRIVYLDFLRILATIAVLLNHIPLTALHYFDGYATTFDKFAINGFVQILHFAVPFFVMITGALLLNKEKPISYGKAWHYAWRIIAILATIGVAFAWMEIYFQERTFSFAQLLPSILNTIEGNSWKHLWYLYMLVGLYLMLPMIKSAVNCLTNKQLDLLIITIYIFVFIFPMVQYYTGILFGIKFPVVSEYVFYLFVGYRLSTLELKIKSYFLWLYTLLFIILYLCSSWFEYMEYHQSLSMLASYRSPFMAVYSILLFYILKNNVTSHINAFFIKFSRDSFGIYIFHMLYVNIIYKVLKINPFNDGYWTLVPIFVCVTGFSWVTTIIFRRLPLIGKYI